MVSTKWFTGEDDLTDAFNIRRRVFTKEQGVPREADVDGSDAGCMHLVVYENDVPVGTGRIMVQEQYLIGRIAVLPEHRKSGYGDLIVRMLVRKCFDMGASLVNVHAQSPVVGFYEKLGFVSTGEEYEAAGMTHVKMHKLEDVGGKCATE